MVWFPENKLLMNNIGIGFIPNQIPFGDLRVLAMHEAKSVNTQCIKNLKDPFGQWSLDKKSEVKVEKQAPPGGRAENGNGF